MLSTITQHIWKELIATATEQELIWIDGYLSGLLSGKERNKITAGQSTAISKITIAYGTETGNAKALSAKLSAFAKTQGFQLRLVSLEQYKPTDLQKESFLFVVVSTQGDGEPPAAARKFYDFLHVQPPALSQLNYAVLGLGDSSYPLFCKTGEDIYVQLEKTGAKAFAPLLKCDTDYEEVAQTWFEQALQTLKQQEHTQPIVITQTTTKPSKKKYKGLVLTHINLNDTGSSKETYHIELQTDALYEPGDAIGIYPVNNEALVKNILELSGIEANTQLSYRQEIYTVYALLKDKLNITWLQGRVIEKYAAIVQQEIPVAGIGLLELLKIYGIHSSETFLEVLQVLESNVPRLYSVSSSPAAHNDELHITVSRNKFLQQEEIRYGLCSNYLSQFIPGEEIEFYVHSNRMFRLPEPDKDIIMIGPGTGIAPFRAYLADREATGATGRNWLFFGEQHFVSDFLYQTEIQSWQETGLLNKVNVAFSRDQEEKIYVQHKMLQHGEDLYNWLEEGASVYICGSKYPMSIDVETALLQIIREQGQKTEAEAEAYLEQLKSGERYHTDVY
ncbi:MAG: flavodoxin domain-containing protein [Taibaiella sp.]|jgi:sulfite reductase (NADPH) flavoprotein alpha-component